MPRGRPPKPIELPPEQAGSPIMPGTIERDPIARELWVTLVDLLLPNRVLSPTDGPVLVSLCSSYSLLVKARDILEREGFTIHNEKNGSTKIHPCVNLASGAARDVKTFAAELGLSPTARARILHLQEVEEKGQSMDEFLEDDADA